MSKKYFGKRPNYFYKNGEMRLNAKIIMNNIISKEIPSNILLDINIDRILSFFDDIYFEEKAELFEVDDSTKLITEVKIKAGETPSYIFDKGVESISFIDYKDSNKYREIRIPNLLYYLSFIYNALLIREKLYNAIYKDIDYNYSNSNILNDQELYQFINYDEIAIENEYYYRNLRENNKDFKNNLMKENFAEGTHIYYLTTDIESYYNNIYSHHYNMLKTQYPYKEVKDLIKFLEYLDIYNMRINHNQTKGIITGPLSSYISAELLGIFLDSKIHEVINKNKKTTYIRYVDDMTFYSNDVAELEVILREVQNILKIYNLSIKEEKTKIDKGFKPRKESRIYEIFQEFPHLEHKYEKQVKYDDSIFYKVKRYIEVYISQNNFTQLKTFLSLMISNFKDTEVLMDRDILIQFVNYFLKLGHLYNNLQSRSYKLINELINHSSNKDREEVKQILKDNTEHINNVHHDTIAQIWHYHLLNKLLNYNEKNIEFNMLIQYYERDKFKTDINPLVLIEFVTKSKKRNKKIFDYVWCKYLDSIENTDACKDTISHSKWWIVLLTLRYKGDFKINNLDNLFFSKKNIKQMKHLGVYEDFFKTT
ncbi:RNA-directed DNA polymerase [Salinicoccus luteus]|uniref:RNA-directed DNA polymerase n=1 Tax=Salinicoccus luteus TaxID=367840 RepID=UPI0004E2565C|nr:RNA-directed DNA polymerase [Salinicoccus luteus]